MINHSRSTGSYGFNYSTTARENLNLKNFGSETFRSIWCGEMLTKSDDERRTKIYKNIL
ncbi:hypothetical protein [Candidatus Nardonella dryophthoridicola]|uniref:Transposase n=1 Tax=endosymbiont of Metamasius hemipterus TaxID=204627 RepID=A0ABT0TWL9_9GAMM|nr:hypothetical protein [Candidatus Nardonella dryophthoridicola]MCM0158349.1 hypothetical protein [endosymbiont of Metamasius hemipterus]